MASKKEAPAAQSLLLCRFKDGYACLFVDSPEMRERLLTNGWQVWAIEGTRLTVAEKPVEEAATEQGNETNPRADTQA